MGIGINGYWDQMRDVTAGNEEVYWELCSALQCLGVDEESDRVLIHTTQQTIINKFVNIETVTTRMTMKNVHQEMHYHILAAILVAGPSRVIKKL